MGCLFRILPGELVYIKLLLLSPVQSISHLVRKPMCLSSFLIQPLNSSAFQLPNT